MQRRVWCEETGVSHVAPDAAVPHVLLSCPSLPCVSVLLPVGTPWSLTTSCLRWVLGVGAGATLLGRARVHSA